MSHMTSIIRKEVRELLTPGSVISVLVMVVLFAGLGGLIGGEVDSAAELPTFGFVVDEDGQYYNDWNPYDVLCNETNYGAEADSKIILMDSAYGDDEAILAEMREKGITSVLALPDADSFRESMTNGTQVTMKQYYLYEPTGLFGTVSSSVLSSVVSILNTSLSQEIMSSAGTGLDYDFVTNPIVSGTNDVSTIVDGEVHTGITPSDISNEITSQTLMIPIVIMIIIMMVGSIVISSMGSEKENKTLETLLTMPIKRTSIVSGKIVAAAIVGLVYGLAYMVGMSIYMGSMTGTIAGSSSVNLEDLGMSLDILDWFLIMVSMFLAIVCALGICMILGAFAKNYKSAQTMTMPLSILAMIPMFIIMFTGWYGSGGVLQAITFAIPFSHPMMAMQALMYGDMTLVLGGIAYMAVFALVSILITVRLYNSDILITGLGQNKYVQSLTGRK
ncbi:MAG: hypothetical protein A3205_01015 [Methanomassiliicoccales archaeon Mx-03]|nr:MAG: hypothetical protein A3205_01015 [Methanomassiliicoccales archaeon Mx-03]